MLEITDSEETKKNCERIARRYPPVKSTSQNKDQSVQETRPFRRRRKKEYICVACQQTVRFAWTCSCGFAMCQECMQENLWGMTCNNITWACPDCGKDNGFGNQ